VAGALYPVLGAAPQMATTSTVPLTRHGGQVCGQVPLPTRAPPSPSRLRRIACSNTAART
jgi:hypothetical protein